MTTRPDDPYREVFADLTARCRALTRRYALARQDDGDGERHSTIAFEFGYLFMDARQVLPDDPDHPWGMAAFETAFEEIRSDCYPDASDDDTAPDGEAP